MPSLIREIEKLGWELYDAQGAKQFYKKQLNEQEVRISILPKEKGGLEEKYATTLVIVKLEPAKNVKEKGSNSDDKNGTVLKTYNNKDYHVSLKYPLDWELNSKYIERYDGKDGFFQLSAINGEGLTIDIVTEFNAFHHLKPYGSNPQIRKLKIQGQRARLILPSTDQRKEMQSQAGLIVEYPTAVEIDNATYYYFILWADKAHIQQIRETITFVY